MRNNSMEVAVRQRFAAVKSTLNERQRRIWAAAEAKELGYGGISTVTRATGISRRAIHVAPWMPWSSRPRGATRCRRCGGRA